MKSGDILGFYDMYAAEGKMLQQGMNFRTDKPHSVLLMSQRSDAPYPDRLSEDGKTLFYIGHDAYGHPDKKHIDQPLLLNSNTLTQNGKFFRAVESVRQQRQRELIRVYEKLKPGIWVFNGLFELRDAKMEFDGSRKVCVFELSLVDGTVNIPEEDLHIQASPGRLIPTNIKLQVWKRDKGRCVVCGETKDLHFDHILPFAKGGSSTNAQNIQLLCQKHNLMKSDRII